MFSISTNSLPRIRSYADALQFWGNAKPQDDQYRALNTKRDTSKRVWREGDTIHFRLYHTDVVSYLSPTQVCITPWDSVSTCTFCSCLAPRGIEMHGARKQIRVNNHIAAGRFITFTNVDGRWMADSDDVMPEYRYVVDRKKATAAIKPLQPFLRYCESRRALQGLKLHTIGGRYPDVTIYRLIEEAPHEKNWPQLFQDFGRDPGHLLCRAATVVAGAVRRERLPFGVPATPSVFDDYRFSINDPS